VTIFSSLLSDYKSRGGRDQRRPCNSWREDCNLIVIIVNLKAGTGFKRVNTMLLLMMVLIAIALHKILIQLTS
jgi:hypothetical protein